MGTKWLDAPFSEYMIHKIAESEGGYNYYLYIHSRGQAIVMREKTDETEYKYADAGRGSSGWGNRAGLDYKDYDDLVK